MTFLIEQLKKLSSRHQVMLSRLLLGLFRQAMHERHDGPYDHDKPAPVTVPARHAAYSANLVLLIALISGEVTARQLFPESSDPVKQWCQIALLWRSQLTPEGWSGLVHTLAVSREWDGEQCILLIRPDHDSTVPPPVDPYWSYERGPGSEYRGSLFRWRFYEYDDMRRHSYFICDSADDTIMHTSESFTGTLGPAVGTLHGFWQDRALSPANALITLWVTAGRRATSDEELAHAHETVLLIALDGFFTKYATDVVAQRDYCELAFRQLAADQHRLPPQ